MSQNLKTREKFNETLRKLDNLIKVQVFIV